MRRRIKLAPHHCPGNAQAILQICDSNAVSDAGPPSRSNDNERTETAAFSGSIYLNARLGVGK